VHGREDERASGVEFRWLSRKIDEGPRRALADGRHLGL